MFQNPISFSAGEIVAFCGTEEGLAEERSDDVGVTVEVRFKETATDSTDSTEATEIGVATPY